MQIAVIGAGNVGSTLGEGWIGTGHRVTFGVREPSARKHQELVQRLGATAAVTTVPDAVVRREDNA